MIGILLAAGRGTRMKSEDPKVLFALNDEPLCLGPLKALMENCEKVVVVIGYRGADVRDAVLSRASEIFGEEAAKTKISFYTQNPPRGTGDAVRTAIEGLGKTASTHSEVLIVNGDLALIRGITLKKFADQSRESRLTASCLSMRTSVPAGLGRILREDKGVFTGIREEKDASVEEKKIREVNGGVYYFKMEVLTEALKKLTANNKQNEFYLTDLLGNKDHGKSRSEAILSRAPWDLMGVNTTYELSAVRKIAQNRLQKKLCEDYGVDFQNPESTLISARVKFEGPCTIGPSTVILGKCSIGTGVIIEGCNRIIDSKILSGAKILWSSVIEESTVGANSQVGPMAHLRPGSELGADVKIGNFVELKKTRMGRGAKASHLSYLGDAEVGEEANIGCGTITCNYDGVNKYPTVIGKRAFIGSDTQLIAPLNVGDDAYVASGTTVTQDVPSGALALSRPDLILKPGYAKRLTERLQSKKKVK